MQHVAPSLATSTPQLSVVIPQDVWSLIFKECASSAELYLTPDPAQPRSGIKVTFVNAPIALLALCTTSREAFFCQLVVFVNVRDVTRMRQSIPPTILSSILNVKRALRIPPNMPHQNYNPLDLDDFPALRKLDAFIGIQLRSPSEPRLLTNISQEDMRKEVDYTNILYGAGVHFKRGGEQHVNAVDYTWARYLRNTRLADSVSTIEENMGVLSNPSKREVAIKIYYEIKYLIQQGPGLLESCLPDVGCFEWARRNGIPIAAEKPVVVTWKTTFPKHEISGKKVVGL